MSLTRIQLEEGNRRKSAKYLEFYLGTDGLDYYGTKSGYYKEWDKKAIEKLFRTRLAEDLPTGNLTTTTPIIIEGSGQLVNGDLNISIPYATTSQNGLLSSVDWNTFNDKQDALNFGDFTSATSGITIGGDYTGATVGSGFSINIVTASSTQNGLLSSIDWTTFNNKQNALTIGNLSVTSPLNQTGGTGAVIGGGVSLTLTTGTLSTSTTGVTIGTGTSRLVGGNATINIVTAASSITGLLSGTDWDTFNSKVGGTGVANRLAYWSAIGTITSDAGFIVDPTNDTVGIGTTPNTTFLNSSSGLHVRFDTPSLQLTSTLTSQNQGLAMMMPSGGFGHYWTRTSSPTFTGYSMLLQFSATYGTDIYRVGYGITTGMTARHHFTGIDSASTTSYSLAATSLDTLKGIRVDNTGRLSVGTFGTTTATLHVIAATSQTGASIMKATGSAGVLGIDLTDSGILSITGANYQLRMFTPAAITTGVTGFQFTNNSGVEWDMFVRNSGSGDSTSWIFQEQSYGTARIIIQRATSNVGMGINTPTALLHVVDSASPGRTNAIVGMFETVSTGNLRFRLRGSNALVSPPTYDISIGGSTATAGLASGDMAIYDSISSYTSTDILLKFLAAKIGAVLYNNVGFNGESWGGGTKVRFFSNVGTTPTTNPTAGIVEYVTASAYTYRTPAGAIVTP